MQENNLPLVLAGPILRRLQPNRLTFWLVTSSPVECRIKLYPSGQDEQDIDSELVGQASKILKAGTSCFFLLIDLQLEKSLPQDVWVGYDILSRSAPDEPWRSIQEWADNLVYDGRDTPGFVLQSRLSKVLHGSCRKPHHSSQDGLLRADQLLQDHIADPEQWPSLMIMSGDQVYADDVAGPMLMAIHELLPRLGLPEEAIEGMELGTADSLHENMASDLHKNKEFYYRREDLLPKSVSEGPVFEVLFSGAKKPIFTSVNAHNHLISLGEILAMYLLVWSPACWAGLSLDIPKDLPKEFRDRYFKEKQAIEEFASNLVEVRRVLAHLPVAMIFDDHDVSDDWNLTAGWEQAAYGNPLSKRIIGNALIGYLLFQGWGNSPESFPEDLMDEVQQTLTEPGTQLHNNLIDRLIAFPSWHYQWSTSPALIVLDTRTHRWRSERSLNKPSGLMDWEALTDLQHSLLGHESVVVVSPAPMFGVKLIETIQRVFTWFGKPLMVDAENWMAHSGSAYALLNLFRHSRTPKHFIILSGDVHYSFVYQIKLRGRQGGPDIWQITSSGIRNEFPKLLMEIFDRLDRWLYAPWSPLNWFTKRRRMKVTPHKPVPAAPGERLVNGAGIGLVELGPDDRPKRIVQLCSNGEDIAFELDEQEARWE